MEIGDKFESNGATVKRCESWNLHGPVIVALHLTFEFLPIVVGTERVKISYSRRRVMLRRGFLLMLACGVAAPLYLSAAVPAAACGPQPAGLSSWWRAEGNTKDWVGGNNGTPSGGVTFAEGVVGAAFGLDGVDDYIDIGAAASIATKPASTVEAWVYPTALDGGEKQIYSENSGGSVYELYLTGDKACNAIWRGGSWTETCSTTSISPNHWYHVATTLGAGGARLYLNGVLENITSSALPTDQVITAINVGRASGFYYFSGLVDELKLYNRALTATEIQGIYNAGSAGTCAAAALPKSGQTTTYATGDDGDLQIGVPWVNPRFTVVSSASGSVVSDALTGLIWPQDGGTPTDGSCTGGTLTWQGALAYVACLNTNDYLGHKDWRLPNIQELKSLPNAEQANVGSWLNTQGFGNVVNGGYWSSTTYAPDPTIAWFVEMSFGNVNQNWKADGYSVWPVRGGGCGVNGGTTVCLARTGQTTVYAAGDDGSLQQGLAWPTPRFTNLDGTAPIIGSVVVDQLTGLIWAQDGGTPTVGSCPGGGGKTWQESLEYVDCLNTGNYLGYHDWRLPNWLERTTLINHEMSNVPAWLNAQGFINAGDGSGDWSSTTIAGNTEAAWGIGKADVLLYGHGKTEAVGNVWPVRGGQPGTLAQLTVTKSGAGSGSVTTNHGTLVWSGLTGTETLGSNLSVTLTAKADLGAKFAGWAGACKGVGACTVVMAADQSVKATFQPIPVSQILPPALSFGERLVGTVSTTRTVTVTNLGQAPMSITGVTPGGVNPDQFGIINGCGASLAAGEACTVSVTFQPTSSGAKQATLAITVAGPAKSKSIALTGTATTPINAVSRDTMPFVDRLIDTISQAKVVTVSNPGSAPLNITSITLAGANAGQFVKSKTCGEWLAVGADCSVSVTFVPTSIGAKSASLAINVAAPAVSKTVELTGTGVAPSTAVSTTTLTFADRSINTVSPAKTVTVTNKGTAPLFITGITLGGTNAGQFTKTTTCPINGAGLAPGATCTASVTFKPTTVGAKSALLGINVAAPASSKSVTLSGVGML